ncbi:MAG: alcohol dehydrogenase catalytic domain-containing protein [Chloroflexi bacterium]|nr:alcohol dehydrogenase catalytic domain-containing protein [Chloroflexota bacterium]
MQADSMRALVYTGPRQLDLQESPSPSPGAEEVIIRVAFAGICGSELSGYLGHNALRVPPLVMGHEFAGEIAALGADAQAQNPDLAEGQLVTANPLTYCGSCEFCARGMNHLCTTRQLIGAHRPGAYAEYVSVPAKLVMPLPAGMSLHTGALTEPAACGVRIGELAGPINGQAALVIGAGPIGLLGLQALQAQGASRVFIADVDPARLAMGTTMGGEPIDPNSADVVQAVRDATDGYGVPVSVDAVGTTVTRAQCVGATRSTGTLILVGLHEETSAMPAAEIIRREIVVRGSFGYTPENFSEALQRLADDTMRLDPWVVEAPLAAGAEWFERLVNAPGDVSKVLLVP